MISFQNVVFAYDDSPILRDVNLNIKAGEYIGIIGPNGGGKTTLLKLILGFLKPQKGTITVDNAKLAYVPQQRRYDRHFPLSVEELVSQGLLHSSHWQPAVAEALQLVGLSAFTKKPFRALSGGQLQRALIARALVSNPSILLLDEPTANLDPEAQEDIHTLLRSFKKKMTILMVSHDLNTIINEVDRILCVQGTVSSTLPKDLCKHFAMGLYHKPILENENPL